MKLKKRALLIACCFASAIGVMSGVSAQDFPTKVIRFVVPYAAGSVTDIVARIVATDMTKTLGQPIIVENRPGADTVIAFDHVARVSPADGYTVLLPYVSGLVTMPILSKNLQFDPLKDLVPVIDLTDSRLVFGSAAQFPWKTMPELVTAARAQPNKLNYGTASPLTKIMMQGFAKDFGVQAVEVPFTGGGPWTTALGQGTVEMGFISEGAAVTLGERLRALAVTGETRSPNYPNTPTFKELGQPNYRGLIISLSVRSGTPKAAIDKLHNAAASALKDAEIRKRLQGAGFDVIENSTPKTAAQNLAEQAKFFAAVAK